MPRTGRVIVVLATVAAVLVTGQVVGATSSKPPYVEVAHGHVAGDSWSLAIAGRGTKRCYKPTLNDGTVGAAIIVCGPDRRPTADWTQLGGIGDDRASIQLVVTKKRVRSMRMRIRHPHSGVKASWVLVKTHRMSVAEAREAHVKRNFRAAVPHSRGNFCVTKMVLLNSSGARIKSQRLRCES